jgi:hypothetical protein
MLSATPTERAGNLPDRAWTRVDAVTWVAPLNTQPPGWGEVALMQVSVLYTGDRSSVRPPVHMRGQVT